MNEMLSPHFSRDEFEHSDTAILHGVANVMGPIEFAAAKALCFNVFEPIRAHFGRPVVLNSGYRGPAVNKLVGSKPGSQHERGEAGDHEIAGVSNYDLAMWIAGSTIAFDQLILEAYTPGVPSSGWVHVSYRVGRARRSVLTMVPKAHGPLYLNGLQA
jgi:hypothetical protein